MKKEHPKPEKMIVKSSLKKTFSRARCRIRPASLQSKVFSRKWPLLISICHSQDNSRIEMRRIVLQDILFNEIYLGGVRKVSVKFYRLC
jgi:hypothetical protein